jgi:hypothetical protein
MAYRRKRAPNKGKKCTRYKRVRVKGQGMARRCAKFGSRRSKAGKRRRSSYRRRPFNKGKTCKIYGYHFNKKAQRSVRYCASYGSMSGWQQKRAKGYGKSAYHTAPVSSAPRYSGAQAAARQERFGRERSWWQRLLGTG